MITARRDGRTAELLRGHGQEPAGEGRRTVARPAQPCRRGKDLAVNDLKDLLELALTDGYQVSEMPKVGWCKAVTLIG